MKKIAKVIEKNLDNPEFLNEYLENLKEREAIGVVFLNSRGQELTPVYPKKGIPPRQLFSYNELKNKTFIIRENPQRTGRLLIYNKQLPNKNWISIRASLIGTDTYKAELYLFNIVACIVTLLLAALIGKIFSKKITADVEKLNNIAYRIANLEFIEKTGIERDDEIGELAKNMERMSKKLKISIEGMKSFVSNASHELKTPVAVINSTAQLLLKNEKFSEQKRKEYYEILLKTSKEMNELITNLLTISKINSIDYSLTLDEIDIKNLIFQSLEKYDFLELDNDIEVNINIDSPWVVGDKKLLKLVIDNLVMNGLKYSPYEGEFNIYQKENIVYFENSISKDIKIDIDKVWDPFYRGEGKTESEKDGTGLGLSIVKKILELHKFKYGISIQEDRFCIWIKFTI
jgi:signal transduction histidine kinase